MKNYLPFFLKGEFELPGDCTQRTYLQKCYYRVYEDRFGRR